MNADLPSHIARNIEIMARRAAEKTWAHMTFWQKAKLAFSALILRRR